MEPGHRRLENQKDQTKPCAYQGQHSWAQRHGTTLFHHTSMWISTYAFMTTGSFARTELLTSNKTPGKLQYTSHTFLCQAPCRFPPPPASRLSRKCSASQLATSLPQFPYLCGAEEATGQVQAQINLLVQFLEDGNEIKYLFCMAL